MPFSLFQDQLDIDENNNPVYEMSHPMMDQNPMQSRNPLGRPAKIPSYSQVIQGVYGNKPSMGQRVTQEILGPALGGALAYALGGRRGVANDVEIEQANAKRRADEAYKRQMYYENDPTLQTAYQQTQGMFRPDMDFQAEFMKNADRQRYVDSLGKNYLGESIKSQMAMNPAANVEDIYKQAMHDSMVSRQRDVILQTYMMQHPNATPEELQRIMSGINYEKSYYADQGKMPGRMAMIESRGQQARKTKQTAPGMNPMKKTVKIMVDTDGDGKPDAYKMIEEDKVPQGSTYQNPGDRPIPNFDFTR